MLTHAIPSEFSDEDKWFKYFTKKMLAFILPGVVLTFLLFKLLSPYGQGIAGVVIGLTITAVLGAISAIPMPESEYIKGGGLTLDILIARRYIRLKEAVIYAKGI